MSSIEKKPISWKAELIKSAVLSALLLVLAVLAIRGDSAFPDSIPQNRYWTDNIVDFLASCKGVFAVTAALLLGLYRMIRIPDGLPSKIWTVLWAVLIPGLSFVCVEAYNRGYWHIGARVSYENAPPFSRMFLLNLLLYYLFFLGLFFLLGSIFAGYAVAASVLMGIAIVNYYVQQFRGSPIVPWDFLSVRTAANVAGNFEYKIYWQMLLATLFFVFLLLTIGKMKAKLRLFPGGWKKKEGQADGAPEQSDAAQKETDGTPEQSDAAQKETDGTPEQAEVSQNEPGRQQPFHVITKAAAFVRRSGKGNPLVWIIRIAGCAACITALVILIGGLQNEEGKSYWGIDNTLFTPNVRYAKNGFWPAFLSNLSYLHIEKPDGYSPEKVAEIAAAAESEYAGSAEVESAYPGTAASESEYAGTAASESEYAGTAAKTGSSLRPEEKQSARSTASSVQHPNIIVIMNEAFSDLSVLGDFETNEDYMPNFRSLMEEYTSGHLMVSVKGGNTANTEYEFLSGDTMAFLPEGCVVFQQYIHERIPTIASFLSGLGYETIGMHPYIGSGWERDRVYPLMGFDEFLDRDDFAGADKLRNYISDKGAFDKVIELFESKEEGRPQFQFLVTMQNHSGYTPKDTDNGFSEEVLLTGASAQSGAVVAAERYLTLIKYSDAAFRDLIDYFEENVTEPTLIVMFGDHEPNDYVTEVIDHLVGNDPFVTASDNSGAAEGTEESLEDVQKHYQVPFVIWNNFDVPKDETVGLTSVNYLGAMLVEEAGLPLSGYQKFLLNQQKTIPALAAGAYIDRNGTYHSWAGLDQDEENRGKINDYNTLEYNHLIDGKNRADEVFQKAS